MTLQRNFTILTDSQEAMDHTRSDAPGPGQDMAIEIIELADVLYEQGNTLTVKWVPGLRGLQATRPPTHALKTQQNGERPAGEATGKRRG